MADIIYNGESIDFKKVFYAYAVMREGKKNVVYLDIKGLPTVGIGHLVTAADDLSVGDAITNAQVEALFDQDYDNLHEGGYVQEILDAGYSYNMALAVAHFIWGHGYGQYNSSNLRAGLLNGTFQSVDDCLNYLAANWDLHSVTNEKVNRLDFTIGFSDTPWTSPLV